jgi:hypothetical protein
MWSPLLLAFSGSSGARVVDRLRQRGQTLLQSARSTRDITIARLRFERDALARAARAHPPCGRQEKPRCWAD